MNRYQVRKGTAKKPIIDSYEGLLSLPYEYQKDDGKAATLDTKEDWPDTNCLDCAEQLYHAEACFVPGHRICTGCGSHWELYKENEQWHLRRARFY